MSAAARRGAAGVRCERGSGGRRAALAASWVLAVGAGLAVTVAGIVWCNAVLASESTVKALGLAASVAAGAAVGSGLSAIGVAVIDRAPRSQARPARTRTPAWGRRR
ncbi:putative protein OS=Tsukamurella paurometabola (strain ATCC 8368 / DSM / CCUG 35730 /CIP 100753 / JCM 10117 / KCTC 9821 / NBRC 16120 / NCIMB 702349/ NCTC 13040) OX=521096 GN=Tpau_4254 PE=4 SV=1 [Tsukamurella paurometabola]|uniref:Uncharacterized protein n=1 Tax=Tsukamurella paurometabola (strain ATCC 8368 / DSM 20162 / CCUG 35730 / CIP 100753 / JCM 10117 / KCTC 9821 / NBRC 16120 / NCIMB 702349 / NCTC 13040) TaxID=521096 RepID=D5UYX5_TSUPD|nr:conserved hypothetical protein [Tsukamurella paurometabola DSM 20162]SUQ39272.1 Uncharacterised protein [Tsukamurella paurometabola]